MGYKLLSRIPNSKQWRRALDLLDANAGAAAVAAASAEAIERDLARKAGDPALVEATRLLAMIPQAARSPDFADGLRRLGIDVPDNPTLLDLTAAAGGALDHHVDSHGARSDFSEIVRDALVGTLSALVERQLPCLFESDAEDVRSATERLGRSSQFSVTAREFFSRLTRDSLAHYLSRVLSAQIGPGRAFASIGERDAFDAALDQRCREASRIIKEFSTGWYGKTLYERGSIDRERAAAFAAVCLKKIRAELQRARGDDG